jgi:hypothetical protein
VTSLKFAGDNGSLSHIDAAQIEFRTQIAALNDLMRQLAGNAAISAGSAAQADPLNAPFTLYVNPYIGSDEFVGGSYNDYDAGTLESKIKRLEKQRLVCGFSPQRPFKTINRAVIEAAIITSKDWLNVADPSGILNTVSIVLSPGVHILYNDPGQASTSITSWGESKDPDSTELIKFNPATVGGVLLPRGCSLCGPDLRKTTIRPNWVPAVADEAADYSNRRGMMKITGTGYFFGFTVRDKIGLEASHHLLDAFHFASKSELDAFYAKTFSAVGSGADLGAALTVTKSTEYQIVGPIDRTQSPTSAWDTTSSASPYIFNCSIRSDYGIGGAFMDGSKVEGLKSMVCANFTGTSLQKDMDCWQRYSSGSWTTTTYEQYISTDPDNIRMNPARISRHISAINDAFIQEVSVFAIGQGIHHFTDLGGEITVTNSNSSFGGCAAISKGYKSFSFPQDENWSVASINVPLNVSEKTGNIRRIYLGTVSAVTSSKITLNSGLAISPDSSTVPAILLADGYTLKSNTKVWVENPSGEDWQASLTSSAWSDVSPNEINISAALEESDTGNPVGTDPNTSASLAIGRRVYIRRLIDTRTPSERRVSLQLSNTGSTRLPERNFAIQTDPARAGGAISREFAAGGSEVFVVGTTGVGTTTGVSTAAEITLRRSAADITYRSGGDTYYRAGTIVKHNNKHYQAIIDHIATSTDPDADYWGETFVHMPSAYDAEDEKKNQEPILIFDTDTDSNAGSTDLGINFTTIWTNSGSVRDQYRSATDYLGVYAFLVALGFSSANAHASLVPQAAASRELDPTSDLTGVPTGGAASGLGNWAVEFRRPSTLRLYGHAWEWAGFLNYSKAIPAAQKELGPQNKFTYYYTNVEGGRVVPQGSNEDGFNISPRGLEDIETGAIIDINSIGTTNIDEGQVTSFPNGLSASTIDVDNITINNSATFPAGASASTDRFGVVQLADIDAIDNNTNAATSDAEIEASVDKAITLFGLNRWREQRNLLSGVQAGATLVMLHVASSAGSALTGNDSVPFGYPTTGHTYQGPTGTGLRGTIYSSVTAALQAAAGIYVPVGSEVIISVHDDISGSIEAGPLIIGNGIAPFVVAGARGALATPKIGLKVGTTANAINALPGIDSGAVFLSAGCVFSDIEVNADMNSTSADVVLTLNGGFGNGGRDCKITFTGIGANTDIAAATATYGDKIYFRTYAAGNSYIFDFQYASGVTSSKPVRIMGADVPSSGLMGHGVDIRFDFASLSHDTNFEFSHNLGSGSTTVGLEFLSLGGRGGCSIGGRIEPDITWDLSNDEWDISDFISVADWCSEKNYCGPSFNTPSNGVTSVTTSTVGTLSTDRFKLKGGSSVSTRDGNLRRTGPFGFLIDLEAQQSANYVKAYNLEGSYFYGGGATKNDTSTPIV